MNIFDYFQIALAIVGAFATIATVTPNETDNRIAEFLLKTINVLGANVGRAQNK